MATVAASGGRWLREGGNGPVPELLNGSSSFKYVGSFTGEMPSRGLLRRAETVSSPEQWLVALRSCGVSDLSLLADLEIGGPLPRHVASAFSNSGTWALLATGNAASAIWKFGWAVGDPNAPDSRIWSVSASQRPAGRFTATALGVAEARERLSAASAEIKAFAQRFDDLRGWVSWFAKADALLNDPDPVAPYHQDLLPSDAALDRRQLAASAVQGWVFGGMGSWNDSGPADPAAQREYEYVGANLYAALLAALSAAANGA